jgi:hypothetical protein
MVLNFSLRLFRFCFFALSNFVSLAKITVSLLGEISETNPLFRFEAKFFRFLFGIGSLLSGTSGAP